MKRLALITLSAIFTLSLLVACGENQRNNVSTPSHTDTTTSPNTTNSPSSTPTDTTTKPNQ